MSIKMAQKAPNRFFPKAIHAQEDKENCFI